MERKLAEDNRYHVDSLREEDASPCVDPSPKNEMEKNSTKTLLDDRILQQKVNYDEEMEHIILSR